MADSKHRLEIQAEFDAKKAERGLDKLEREVDGLGKEVKETDRNARRASDSLGKMGGGKVIGGINKMTGALIGAAAAIGGLMVARQASQALGRVVTETINLGDALQKTSIRTGASVEFLSEMTFAAEQSGSGFADLATGVRRLARAMSDADEGLLEAQRSFDALGINVQDAHGNLRSIESIMPEIADAFSRMTDDTKAAALAQELFGRGGTQLLPMLKLGAKGLNEYAIEAQKLGISFDRKFADNAARAQDSMNEVRKAVLGLKVAFAAELLPSISNVAKALTEKLTTPELREKLAGFAEDIGTALEKVPSMLDKLPSVVGKLATVLEAAAKTAGLVLKAAGAVDAISNRTPEGRLYGAMRAGIPPLGLLPNPFAGGGAAAGGGADPNAAGMYRRMTGGTPDTQWQQMNQALGENTDALVDNTQTLGTRVNVSMAQTGISYTPFAPGEEAATTAYWQLGDSQMAQSQALLQQYKSTAIDAFDATAREVGELGNTFGTFGSVVESLTGRMDTAAGTVLRVLEVLLKGLEDLSRISRDEGIDFGLGGGSAYGGVSAPAYAGAASASAAPAAGGGSSTVVIQAIDTQNIRDFTTAGDTQDINRRARQYGGA